MFTCVLVAKLLACATIFLPRNSRKARTQKPSVLFHDKCRIFRRVKKIGNVCVVCKVAPVMDESSLAQVEVFNTQTGRHKHEVACVVYVELLHSRVVSQTARNDVVYLHQANQTILQSGATQACHLACQHVLGNFEWMIRFGKY